MHAHACEQIAACAQQSKCIVWTPTGEVIKELKHGEYTFHYCRFASQRARYCLARERACALQIREDGPILGAADCVHLESQEALLRDRVVRSVQ